MRRTSQQTAFAVCRYSLIISIASLLAIPLSQALAQDVRPADVPAPASSQYLELEHHPSTKLDPAVTQLIHARQHEIAAEAAFFGYTLDPAWDFDLTACPAMPDEIVLHYRKHFPNGAESLFTAVVPRNAGRVYVVPVLYRNATPFRSATGSERSIAVFNRVVPDAIAAKAIDPNGKWLALALCYADIVYGNANAMQRAGSEEIGLARAPLPLLRLSEAKNAAGVLFTDRNAPGEYLVWNITLNEKGRVIAASALQLSDYVARVRNGREPVTKPLPEGQEPKIKVLPRPTDPPVKPTPQ